MAIQRTLLDGDTGAKFSSLELLAGAAEALIPPVEALRVMSLPVSTPQAYATGVPLQAALTGAIALVGAPFATWNGGTPNVWTFTETGTYLMAAEAATSEATDGSIIISEAVATGLVSTRVGSPAYNAAGVGTVAAPGNWWLTMINTNGMGGNITSGNVYLVKLA